MLNIIDHSKYVLNSKDSLDVFSKIQNFIETHGPCKYLITDNRKEFKNTKLKEYCEQKRIKFI